VARSRNHGCNGSTTLHRLYSYTTYVSANNMKHIVLDLKRPIFVQFLSNLNFLYGFSLMVPGSDFTKNRPVGTALINADRQIGGRTIWGFAKKAWAFCKLS
jgi:hypothetical protein